MVPLSIEVYGPNRSWIKVGEVRPGDPAGSISDNKPDGSRDVYIFECSPDDSKSIIYRSRAGLDTEIGYMRAVATTKIEVVKELRKGDEPYEMKIKTDKSQQERLLRFTHK